MKKIISLVLVSSLLLVGCSAEDVVQNESLIDESSADSTEYESNYVDLRDISYLDNEAEEMNFDSLCDPELLDFMEGAVYYNLIDEIGEDAYIENVSALYISQEYIDELTYNSQANIFFGYTLQELNEQLNK